MAADHDVYVVSDLHLGEGWLPEQQRYARLETFFYDTEFRNFAHAIIDDQLEKNRSATIVLNGDVFDFLAVVRLPDDASLRAAGLRLTRSERKFGLGTTEEHAIWKMDRILRGHREFVIALAELLAAGHRLVVMRGNHDAELFWDGVQRRFLDHLAQTAEDEGVTQRGAALLDRVEFRQWFLYEPGRYYIEHGNQYEASNAFRYVLNPVLPDEYHANRKTTLDYPIGSLFVRYLYNKMKLLDPFTTHFVTLDQYVRVTYHHNFMDLMRTGTVHFPFFFRAIRDARLFELQGMGPIKDVHEGRMATLRASSGLGAKLDELESMKSHPVGTTKYRLLTEMLRPVLRSALTFSSIGLLSVLCWFFIFATIQQTGWLAEGLVAKASLLAILAVITVVGLFIAFTFLNRALHNRADPVVLHCYDRAERIALLLDVPNVSMGHTHTADFRDFKARPGHYANTGTWIPHPGPWDTVQPKARQFTFVRIVGTDMRLLRWDDANRRWQPVTLLEEYHPTAFERLLTDADGEHHPPGAEDI